MKRSLDLEIGNWYRSQGALFEVIAWDERSQTLEIQYYDGSVEELDLESWDAMEVRHAAPPEDWAGAFDDVERADLDEGEAAVHIEGRGDILNGMEF